MWNKLCWWIAFHLPASIAYYTAIRVISFGTVGKYSNTIVPELTGADALKRFSKDHGIE